MTDLLVETKTCNKTAKRFNQICPEEDRNGFIFSDELSEDWSFINQTEILVFHSWIAEYVKIDNISLENGRKKVMFQEPLSHAAVGDWIASGDLRFLIFNNLALLDMPGEYVCVVDGGEALFSYIPPNDLVSEIMSKLETILTILRNITLQGLIFQHSAFTI